MFLKIMGNSQKTPESRSLLYKVGSQVCVNWTKDAAGGQKHLLLVLYWVISHTLVGHCGQSPM